MDKFKALSLFSGIGGFELGLSLAGLDEYIEVTQFVEINLYCQQVLKKHYPNTSIHSDVTTFTAEPGSFDIICAGFPCTDLSLAGKQAGIRGEQSGLFFEVVRLICLVRPRFVLLENVPGLLVNGMGDVLKELSESGYNAQWSTLSCAEMGGVHKRERVFIFAYPKSTGWYTSRGSQLQEGTDVALVGGSDESTDTDSKRLEAWQRESGRKETFKESKRSHGSDDRESQTQSRFCRENARISRKLDSNLMTHSDLPEWLPKATDTDNIPYRKERLQALGNAINPDTAATAWKKFADLAGLKHE